MGRSVTASPSPTPDRGQPEEPGTAEIPAVEAPTEAVRAMPPGGAAVPPGPAAPAEDHGDRIDAAIDSVLGTGRSFAGQARGWLDEMDHRLYALTVVVAGLFLLLVALA